MSGAPGFSSLDAVSEAALRAACGSRAAGVSLLTRAVEVSAPGTGRRLLEILGRVSTAAFLGGVLEVRLQPDADWTMIDLFVDTGSEVSRLAPTLLSAVPFGELSAASCGAAPLTVAGAISPRRVRLRGPEPVADAEPGSDVLAGALVFPEPPTRKRSVPPPRARSVPPAAHKPPAPKPTPAPRPAVDAPRRPAPSDVKATVRADAPAAPARRPSSAPRAPRPDVKATIKVETVHIPKEAIGGKKAVAPPRELLRKVDRTSALIPRDEEE